MFTASKTTKRTPGKRWKMMASGQTPVGRLFSPKDSSAVSPATSYAFSQSTSARQAPFSQTSSTRQAPQPYQREDEFENFDPRDICMAVCIAIGRIGAAYYDPAYGRINVFEDVVESYANCDTLKALIAHVQPTELIASAKQDEKVMRHLKAMCIAPVDAMAFDREFPNATDMNMNKPRLTLLRAWDFGYTSCKQRIYTVVGKNTSGTRDQENRAGIAGAQDDDTNEAAGRLRAAFAVNFDASCMVRAFGALLKFLNLKRLGKVHTLNAESVDASIGSNRVQHDDEAAIATGIFGVGKFTLEKTLLIDVGSFEALQIFQQQFHPSVYKAGRSGMKEGLSLFGICDHCRSGPGAMELRRWFLRPLTDLTALKRRLDAVRYLADDNNEELVDAMGKTLQNIRHLMAILNHMHMPKVSVRDWASFYKTLVHCCRLGDLLRMREKTPVLLTELADKFGDVLNETRMLISQMVDFEASRKENRIIILAGIDEELDARKQFYDRLPEFMTAVANQEMLVLNLIVEECNIIYVPLLGYLLMIPQPPDCGSETGSALENEGLELVFVAENNAYYKSVAMRRMDTEIGDVKLKIVDRETSIALNLQRVILDQAGALLEAVHSAAQVDCLISLAVAARTFNWTKPDLVEDRIIDIEDCRHPLLEVVSQNQQFVPNPVKSGVARTSAPFRRPGTQGGIDGVLTTIRHGACFQISYPKVHFLTGPNASGKSVYLKQIGLLVYMAHVGSFVPAKKAIIGIFDGIFTRLRTMDSVTSGLSSFAIDLRQMAGALTHASGRSLVLVDEFGKGTCTDTGIGLLGASLAQWLEKDVNDCPHIFVCSHLYGVNNSLPESALLEFQTMNVLRHGDQLIFLYKLVDGSVANSYAVNTAQVAGLPSSVVERAVDISAELRNGVQVRRSDMTEADYQREYHRMNILVDQFMVMDFKHKTRPLVDILEECISEAANDEASTENGRANS